MAPTTEDKAQENKYLTRGQNLGLSRREKSDYYNLCIDALVK